jgi:hypothetical protein
MDGTGNTTDPYNLRSIASLWFLTNNTFRMLFVFTFVIYVNTKTAYIPNCNGPLVAVTEQKV